MFKKKVFEKGKTYTYEEIEEILGNSLEVVAERIIKATKGSRKCIKDKEMREFKETLDRMKILCELSVYHMYVLGKDLDKE